MGLNCEVKGTIRNVVFEVTYTKLPQKGNTNLSSKNKPIIFFEQTTEIDILDDLDHEPWIMQHLCWLAHTSSYDIIQLGDGAKSYKKKKKIKSSNTPEDDTSKHNMWCNKWRSGESEMVCCISSISNTLYFVGDSEAGESIKKLRHISRDQPPFDRYIQM